MRGITYELWTVDGELLVTLHITASPPGEGDGRHLAPAPPSPTAAASPGVRLSAGWPVGTVCLKQVLMMGARELPPRSPRDTTLPQLPFHTGKVPTMPREGSETRQHVYCYRAAR